MRLAAKIAALVIAGLGVLFAAYGFEQVEQLREQLDADMRLDQQTVGRLFKPSFERTWRQSSRENALHLIEYTKQTFGAEEVASRMNIRWVTLDQSEEGRAPAVPRSELGQVLAGREQSVVWEHGGEERLFTYIPLELVGAPQSALEISESRALLSYLYAHGRRNLIETLLLLAGICTGIVVAVGVWFVGRPISQLVLAARRIGAGDLSTRVKVRSRDELGILGREMNLMREEIARARREIESEGERKVKAVEQLRHADRLATVGQLASGVAHELGTPLAVVAGRAELIASRMVEGDTVNEYAESIRGQAQKMSRIVRDLLNFARKRQPTLTVVNVVALVERSLALVEPMTKKHMVTIHLEKPDRPLSVRLDALQMEQVFSNLVVNAIQSMPEGGDVRVRVQRVRAKPPADLGGKEADYAAVAVEDRGEGIPDDALDHIFEPFFTTKPIGKGTGLGLAVSYGIVKEHGGWIDVKSVVGEGSRFTVYLRA